jgi:hypothetical protein
MGVNKASRTRLLAVLWSKYDVTGMASFNMCRDLH